MDGERRSDIQTDAPRALRQDLPARGGSMAYYDYGPPERPVDVVFSHANGFNARAYRSILLPLARDLRILAVDQRGHGRTDLPTPMEGRSDWNDLRGDLAAFLAALDVRDAVIAGHSIGSVASLLTAPLVPGRAREVVLFDPVLGVTSRNGPNPMADGALRRRDAFPDHAAAMDAYRGRGPFKGWNDEMLADYVEDGLRPNGEGGWRLSCAPAWEASNFAVPLYDPRPLLSEARVPVTIYRAGQHSSTGFDEADIAKWAIPGVAMITVPNTTHFLPMQRPDVMQDALRAAATRR
ncbi:MAG: alpha/beta hydrolase [Phenylobacterium sp.]|uniref:alpha/beta fold hydrolase n=1 Tax=Phenylobacterium sp. TaxID=1871053 RepID=UPI00273713FC|nr:alpha/beta hydrolase [Phenylobacterium sp.]MDP3174668.1 alpha/beta hydrolase [Phenylobacterium sp.]